MRNKDTIPWSDDEIAYLKKQWSATGSSASLIGDRLGRTRNSIIGKAHRLNLATPPADGRARHPKSGLTVGVRGGTRIGRPKAPEYWKPTPQGTREIKRIEADEIWTWAVNRVHITDLATHHCRWPVGGLFFCGGDKGNNLTYCSVHAAHAYASASARPQAMVLAHLAR